MSKHNLSKNVPPMGQADTFKFPKSENEFFETSCSQPRLILWKMIKGPAMDERKHNMDSVGNFIPEQRESSFIRDKSWDYNF